MTDEALRRAEQAAKQGDPDVIVRLQRMRARLNSGPGLLPVEIVMSEIPPEWRVEGKATIRAWLLCSSERYLVILDERVVAGRNRTAIHERGTLFRMPMGEGALRVPEWFLDGGAP